MSGTPAHRDGDTSTCGTCGRRIVWRADAADLAARFQEPYAETGGWLHDEPIPYWQDDHSAAWEGALVHAAGSVPPPATVGELRDQLAILAGQPQPARETAAEMGDLIRTIAASTGTPTHRVIHETFRPQGGSVSYQNDPRRIAAAARRTGLVEAQRKIATAAIDEARQAAAARGTGWQANPNPRGYAELSRSFGRYYLYVHGAPATGERVLDEGRQIADGWRAELHDAGSNTRYATRLTGIRFGTALDALSSLDELVSDGGVR
jgi:alkylated DNA nucleotide flippase Atl1